MAGGASSRPAWRTRSQLRRLGQVLPGRRRNRIVRYAATGLVLVGIVQLALVIRGQFFASDGPGYMLYWLHDHVYLRLFGEFWTRLFPKSLIWAIPLAVLAAILGIEFLSSAGLRPFHRRVVLRLMGSRLEWLLPGRQQRAVTKDRWSAELNAPDSGGPLTGGFTLLVARERYADVWQRKREGNLKPEAAPGDAGVFELAAPLRLALRLDPGNPQLLLAALETVMLAPLDMGSVPFARDFKDHLDRIQSIGAWVENETTAISDALALAELAKPNRKAEAMKIVAAKLSRLLRALGPGDDTPPKPVALAADAVVVSALTRAHGLDLGWTYFDCLPGARLLQATQGLAASLQLAETLVDMELWAVRAEAAGRTPPPGGDLHRSLRDLGATPCRGELFAVHGVLE